MNFKKTPLDGLIIVEPKVYHDDRGYFFESFNQSDFEKNEIGLNFVQDNQSYSHKGVLRGLHFQAPPFEQGKFVRVARGAVLDIAVDVRRKSKTFGTHFAIELNDRDHQMLWIPPGFAHGFVTLEDHTIFSYKCTGFYHQPSERGIRYDDPDLNIRWMEKKPTLSQKDLELMSWKQFVDLNE